MILDSASSKKAKLTHGPTTQSPNRISIWIRRSLKASLFLLLVCGALSWLAYRSMHSPPEFYRQALLQPVDELEVAGDRFETELLNAQNAIRLQNNWHSVFRQAEVNGWLTCDCPSKFPSFTPDYVESPRIQFLDSEFSYAFRYRPWRGASWFSPFILIVGDIFVAESSGEIVLRIKQVKSGVVPIPIANFANNMTEHFRRNGMEVAWTEIDGDAAALINIPPNKLRIGDNQFRINSIICRNQDVKLVGESIKTKSATK